MRLRVFGPIFAPLALLACAMGPATPVEVDLDLSLLSVRMSDTTTCSGPAPAQGAEAGWSGTLQGCPWAYEYVVEIDQRTNPVRFVLQEVFGALGGENVLSPIASVTIRDADGRERVFATPERIETD